MIKVDMIKTKAKVSSQDLPYGLEEKGEETHKGRVTEPRSNQEKRGLCRKSGMIDARCAGLLRIKSHS